jgi:hypothetical protein
MSCLRSNKSLALFFAFRFRGRCLLSRFVLVYTDLYISVNTQKRGLYEKSKKSSGRFFVFIYRRIANF